MFSAVVWRAAVFGGGRFNLGGIQDMGKSIKETAVISQGAQEEPLLQKRQWLRLILRAVLWLAGAVVFSAAGSWLILGGVYRDILPFYAVAYVLAALMYFRCSGRLAADAAGTCIGAVRRTLFFIWLFSGVCGLPLLIARLL